MLPDDCLPSLVETWWEETLDDTLRPGLLLQAFVPFVDVQPYELIATGRAEPTRHDGATFRAEPMREREPPERPRLPVAGLPRFEGERYMLSRGKYRPVVVLGELGADLPKEMQQRSARWQRLRTVVVAPYFTADRQGTGGGWPEALVEAARHLEFSHLMWDMLPHSNPKRVSLLRLDQMQVIGRESKALHPLGWVLSEDALAYLREYMQWFLFAEAEAIACPAGLEADGCEPPLVWGELLTQAKQILEQLKST